MKTYTGVYFGMSTSEFVNKFNESPEDTFKKGITKAAYNAIWDAASHKCYDFIDDTEEFLEDMESFLNTKRLEYTKNAINNVKTFINERSECNVIFKNNINTNNKKLTEHEKRAICEGFTNYINSNRVNKK